ncbi:hypothetical protein [Actinokineospora inagensis]|uniref:hypothetical protein n=1 Tax=Actinokineospora inagensis TaxID=103730 RepID=UPI0003FF9523|nr:hypothetical protein [Actinokineospora inagensis]
MKPLLRVVQAVVASALVGIVVWVAVPLWFHIQEEAGYRGEPGTFQVNRCVQEELPDGGGTISCTGRFDPDNSAASSGAVVELIPADEVYGDNTTLAVRQVRDNVYTPRPWHRILGIEVMVGLSVGVLAFAGSLGFAAATGAKWTFGLGFRCLGAGYFGVFALAVASVPVVAVVFWVT